MPRFYKPVGPSSNKAVTPGTEKKENATGKGKKGQTPDDTSGGEKKNEGDGE